LALLGGCVAPSGPQTAAPVTQSCMVPQVKAMPETKASQEKGGIEIAIAVPLFSVEEKIESSIKEVPVSFSDVGRPHRDGSTGTNCKVVEETKSTSLNVTPKGLKFEITINNKLNRVFRGSGAVVQFNIGGQLVNVEAGKYSALSNAIIPPRNSAKVVIEGPAIQENTTIGIYIYDIVTAVDAAGNITEKQNYEWFYDYSMNKVEKQVPGPVVDRYWLAR